MERSEIVVIGHDNAILRQLLENDKSLQLGDVTRITVAIANDGATVTVDSANTSNVITWEGDVVTLRLGGQTLAEGRYRASLRLYSPTWPNGVVLPPFPLEVRAP